jgi:hypothetical protein
MQSTHSFKPPGFNPRAYVMRRPGFKVCAFTSQFVPLRRGVCAAGEEVGVDVTMHNPLKAGLATFHSL